MIQGYRSTKGHYQFTQAESRSWRAALFISDSNDNNLVISLTNMHDGRESRITLPESAMEVVWKALDIYASDNQFWGNTEELERKLRTTSKDPK